MPRATERVTYKIGRRAKTEAARAPLGLRYAPLTRDSQIIRELDSGAGDEIFVELAGRPLHFTHLNKVYFPRDGYTKRNLLTHYFFVAPLLLPFLKERPLVLRRFPNGIEAPSFFQKDAGKGFPEWIETMSISSESKGQPIRYFIANDRAALLYLTNLGCIDHNPWSVRRDDLEHPDYIFFDLDPTPGTPFSTVVKLSRLLIAKLRLAGLETFTKTSGASGMHVFVPIERLYTYQQIRQFVQTVALLVSTEHPDLITLDRNVQRRPRGRIYVDAHQNSPGQSLASVYSVRAFPSAPVSTPLTDRELNSRLLPAKWNLSSVRRRIGIAGDLWEGFFKVRQELEPAVELLEKASLKGTSKSENSPESR